MEPTLCYTDTDSDTTVTVNGHMAGPTAYLVIQREDGYGDVFPLSPGTRYTLGRAATTQDELVQVVLKGLLEAVPAEVGAILAVRENRDLDLLAYHHRDPNARTYHKVSQFVSGEVISSREAILADDVAGDDDLRKRDSLAELRATSLICAPVLFGDDLLGLIHLYCADPDKALNTEDLEFAIAVATQLGAALHQHRRQDSLLAENVELRSQLRLESE